MGVAGTSVDELNTALRHLRCLAVRMGLVLAALVVLPMVLGLLFGGGGVTMGLLIVLFGLIAELWWDGLAIGRALDDPTTRALPPVGVLSAPGLIARRAIALDMDWTGFFGPLRPRRR